MIRSVLVANRGEIARRVFRTCRRLGIATVAVYSDADAEAPHVKEADQAVRLGPPAARESYLLGDKVIQAALDTGAEAIHPGYGFLSENAEFAEAVAAAGLVWIGPPPSAIRAMGLKDAAKQVMIDAGVPTTPGWLGEDQSDANLSTQAEAIGFPVLIKAVAGGGGKGMRRVSEAGEFAAALGAARRESAAAFGDDRVLLEKYVTRPRHIEVQVFADAHGNAVHLNERDCSLQRRHQKVIEEAPAPGMDDATREAVCGAAVRAALAVGYQGAGTIEFIADASEGLRADRIWFMEMNTRLQVEHPVTEMITGQDLVEWQLRVASGEPLPLAQGDIPRKGWAMEARLYAENPSTGFLPSTGPLTHFRLPDPEFLTRKAGEGDREAVEGADAALTSAAILRIDSAVEQGGEVTPFYDPMIAKLIVWAPTRDAAAETLADACRRVEVWPVKTNAAFLARCLDEPEFREGDVDTGFIERRGEVLTRAGDTTETSVIAAALFAQRADTELGVQRGERNDWFGPWAPTFWGLFGFRLNASPRASLAINGFEAPFEIEPGDTDREWCVGTNAGQTRVQLHLGRGGSGQTNKVSIDGQASTAAFRSKWSEPAVIFADGEAYAFSEPDYDHGQEADAGSGAIASPMPGKVIATHTAAGATVVKGAPLVTLEAMKMEHVLTAPFDGVIAELNAAAGDQVSEGVTLVRLEAAEA